MDTRTGTKIRLAAAHGRREYQHIGSGADWHHQKQTETGKAKKTCPTVRVVTPKRPLLVNRPAAKNLR